MYDYLIKNAHIIDGTGSPRYTGSVGVKESRISKIFRESGDISAKTIIDGTGLYLTPGFIDISNHADTFGSLFEEPDMTVLLAQGVTTIIGGNCGTSVAPLFSTEAIKGLSKWEGTDRLNRNWNTMADFFTMLGSSQLTINFGSLVGYSTIHRTLVPEERPFTPEEVQQSLQICSSALDQGALGVSLGLAYSRMNLVSNAELKDLAELIYEKDKILVVHMRHDGDEVLYALDECIQLAAETGVRLHLSHLKVMGQKNWRFFDDFLERLTGAQSNPDINISFDTFPYVASNPFLYVMLPSWITKHGRNEMLQQLQEPSVRESVIAEMKANGYDYHRIIVSSAETLPTVVGSNILQIAKNQGVGIEEALIYLIRATHGQARVIVQAINEDHLDTLIMKAGAMIGSDGIGYGQKSIDSHRFDHPRSFGAFPQFLGAYPVPGKLSWEESIARITSVPAQRYQLSDQGFIKEGYCADLVLFDPEKVSSSANYIHPSQLAQGVSTVFVNGHLVWNEGAFTGKLSTGRIITRD